MSPVNYVMSLNLRGVGLERKLYEKEFTQQGWSCSIVLGNLIVHIDFLSRVGNLSKVIKQFCLEVLYVVYTSLSVTISVKEGKGEEPVIEQVILAR